MNPQLTVFVPAYNEEHNLRHCAEVIGKKMLEIGVTAEVLIVDDGSQDQTGAVADQLAAQDSSIRVIHHKKNGGIGQAFLTACQEARGEWLILIPADLALEPNEIDRYFEAAPGADVVVGLRSDRSDYTLARKVVSFFNIHLIQILFGSHIRQFQYISLYRMEVLREMEIEYAGSAFFLAEIIVKAGALGKRLAEAEIKYAPRVSGKATGAKLRLILLTVRDIFRFWLKWVWLGPEAASRKRQA